MTALLGIGVAGALGAWARYLVGVALQRLSLEFPWGTFTINTVGCLLIAAAAGMAARVPAWAPAIRGEFITGFVGAFTTFSTFSVETVMLARTRPLRAASYVGASTAAGLGAITLGGWLAGRAPL